MKNAEQAVEMLGNVVSAASIELNMTAKGERTWKTKMYQAPEQSMEELVLEHKRIDDLMHKTFREAKTDNL